jgi:cytidylate kinase
MEKRASAVALSTGDEKKKMFLGDGRGFTENIGRVAKREKKEMKRMKKELEQMEEEDGGKEEDLDVLGGMEWDEAVRMFGNGKKNVAKVASKVVLQAKREPAATKRARGAGAVTLKPRGPNVGLKRAKVAKTVGKNYWDRLLHPWQRELEQEKRDLQDEKKKEKLRRMKLKKEVDGFVDREMGLVMDEDNVAVEGEVAEGMVSPESEYWKQHWKRVYEGMLGGDSIDLQKQAADLAEENEAVENVISNKKEKNSVSGMFSNMAVPGLGKGEVLDTSGFDYDSRDKHLRDLEMNLKSGEEAIQAILQENGGAKADVDFAWGVEEEEEGQESEAQSESESENSRVMRSESHVVVLG